MMNCVSPAPEVTICVLTYGDHLRLAQRVIESIRSHCPRSQYRLVVGANAVSNQTLTYLESLQAAGEIDHLIVSPENLNKCPMMRRMFERVNTRFIWWFDDDSYILHRDAFSRWIERAQAAPESTVMWGGLWWCDQFTAFANMDDALSFVRSAPWYRGLPPPSWRPGGKGEFNFENRGTGDGRWNFIVGGCWLIRTSAIRALDWPDRRLSKLGDDIILGEAIRQQGWELEDIGTSDVATNTEPRRGQAGSCLPPHSLIHLLPDERHANTTNHRCRTNSAS